MQNSKEIADLKAKIKKQENFINDPDIEEGKKTIKREILAKMREKLATLETSSATSDNSAEIARLEKTAKKFRDFVNDPEVEESSKPTKRELLKNVEAKIAALKGSGYKPAPKKKPAPAPKPAPKAKAKTEAEIKAYLREKYPDMTKAALAAMSKAKYTEQLDQVSQDIFAFAKVTKPRADELATKWEARWLPAGKSAPKRAATKKKSGTSVKVEEIKYMTKLPEALTDKGVPVCLEKLFMVESDDNYTITEQKDTVKKGETIIVNETGHFVTAFTEKSAMKRCKPDKGDKITTAQHEKVVAGLQAKIEKLEKDCGGKTKKDDDTPPKSSGSKKDETKKDAPKKKRGKCSAKSLKGAEAVAKMMRFIKKHTMKWHDTKTHLEIVGIYGITKTGQVVAKVKDWKGLRVLKGAVWYNVCLDRGELDGRIEAPKKGTYRIVGGLDRRKIREYYTYHEPRPEEYAKYISLYRELLACSKDGTCVNDERWKIAYDEMGDIIQKTKELPRFWDNIHAATKENWQKGKESYPQALKRTVAAERKRLAAEDKY